MPNINHYAISKILGSELTPVKGARFGRFGLLGTTAEVLKAIRSSAATSAPVQWTLDDDRLVARAFEEVRDGASTNTLLCDARLAERFIARAHELELAAPAGALVKRLIHIRKSPSVYAQRGICLSPTTRSEPKPSIVPQYAHVIEFALVRLRYRYGAAIDTILADPSLRHQFESIATQVAPDLTGEQLGLGRLDIRKTRYFSKKESVKVSGLDPAEVEEAMTPPTPLADIRVEDIPEAPGLLELKEQNRFIYVARNDALRAAVGQLRTGRPFEVFADNFWQPSLEGIS